MRLPETRRHNRTHRKAASYLVPILIVVSLVPGWALAESLLSPDQRCQNLLMEDFGDLPGAPTRLTQAKAAAGDGTLPRYCEVQGYVMPQVGFALRLPAADWNQKVVMIGCGGMCGYLLIEKGVCDVPLRRGYACIVSDMGHRGDGGLWAYNNLQAEIDFAYRATHVTAVAGKAIARRHYQAAPQRSYFMGCSAGGHQGLISAQRFPRDFDGIVAGAPSTDLAATSVYFLEAVRAARGADDDPVLSSSAVQLLHDAVLARCDTDDGVKDGILGNPPACRIDPAELACKSTSWSSARACLTPQQVAAAKVMYSGVTASRGEPISPGASTGSELAWTAFAGQGLATHVADIFRFMLFMPDVGPAWNPSTFDLDRDYERLQLAEPLYAASNPDLRRFKEVGGKLLIYQGWGDAFVLPEKTIDYYETVERTMEGRRATQEFVRLFMLPGVNHCAGGTGADAVDFLSYLESWVERGKPPDEILTAHLQEAPPDDPMRGEVYPYRQPGAAAGAAAFTRPAYAYPRRAVYVGNGDPNDGANFRAVEPPPRVDDQLTTNR